MTMRALCLQSIGKVALQDVPTPRPLEGEGLIRVLRAGICSTEHEIVKGYGGFDGVVLGHEFVGRLEEVNGTLEGHGVKIGDRVVGEINLTCATCSVCAAGGIAQRNHCPKRTVVGILKKAGTFAEFLTLPVCNLYRVPDHVTDQQATFAEPLAAAFRIMEQITISATQSVAVIGDGKLGLLIMEVLSNVSCARLVLFGRHENKMALADSKVEKVISSERTASEFEDAFDLVVDACGTPEGLVMAGTITRPLGTIILKTTCVADNLSFNTSVFVIKEHVIIGSRCGNFRMALEALSSGQVNVDKFVAGVYPLDAAEDAYDASKKKGTLQIQIAMEE